MAHLELVLVCEFGGRLLDIIKSSDSNKAKLILERQLLEQIYKELTKDIRTSFNGLFARIKYIQETLDTPASINQQVNTLRIICNKAAHDEIPEVTDSDVFSGATAINELLVWLHPEYQLPELESLVSKFGFKQFTPLPPAARESFTGLLLEWKVENETPQTKKLVLGICLEDNTEVSVILRDNKNVSHSSLAPSLWRYATIYCENLSAIAGRSNCYLDNPQTVVVLEPDFLLDASSISECMEDENMHPEYYIINRLQENDNNVKLLTGKLVNSMFDELVMDPQADYLALFRKALAEMPIPMVAQGVATALAMYKDIQTKHIPQVRAFAESLNDADVHLEPSFVCPRYGLQGRLDLLYKRNGKYSIVELKSGSPRPLGVWVAHQYQVVAYNMIIRNVFSKAKLADSSILYSASSATPHRNVVNTLQLEQRLLLCRNRIVGLMHLLSEDPSKFFDWLRRKDGQDYNPFMLAGLMELKGLLGGLRSFEYEWFCGQLLKIIREIWSVKLGSVRSHSDHFYGHNSLWRQSQDEKALAGKIIRNLKLVTIERSFIDFNFADALENSDFRIGDVVVLIAQDQSIDRQEIFRGSITKLDSSVLQLRIRGGLRSNQPLSGSSLWAVEHDVLEASLFAPMASLISFLRADESRRNVLLGISEPKFNNATLNEDQTIQIRDRMKASEEIHLVQGPPGTGKTSALLTSYIEDQYINTDKRLLIVSFTNRAVDEICNCLIKKDIPFIRTGASQSIEEQVLSGLIEGKKFNEIAEIIGSNRIFVSTVQSANAWHRDLLRINNLDEIIIDEASQITEWSILGLISKVAKVIFIGDQNQLPPILVQKAEEYNFQSPELKALYYGSPNQSLMERLFRVYEHRAWHHSYDTLTRHYRMHEEIASLITDYYKGRLIPALDTQSQELQDSLSGLPDKRVLWIDFPISAQDYYDPLQIKALSFLIKGWNDAQKLGNLSTGIGIVAPYRAMIYALRNELGEPFEDLTCDTVERFQGSERDIILYCIPIRYPHNIIHLQALTDNGEVDRKLNVAISRAKSRLIILGNIEACSKAPHYKHMIDKIKHLGNVIPHTEIIQA